MASRSQTNAAIARVRRMETDRNVAGLIAELDSALGYSRYTIVRSHAAAALGRLGDARAIPHLLALADDPEDNVRRSAYGALARLEARDVTPTLVRGLNDEAPIVRMSAAEAIGCSGAVDSIGELQRVLGTDPDPEVRLYAVEALLRLGDKDVAAKVPDVLQGVSWRVRLHPRWRLLKKVGESEQLG